MSMFELGGEGLKQFLELGAAFLLSAAIGLEREVRHMSAGLRTYTVVGTTAALFLLISKYGFSDVLITGRVVLDPSRVAAQIVTGIGFIYEGLIFVKGDRVTGPTTAATVGLSLESEWPVAPDFLCLRWSQPQLISSSLSFSPES